MPRDIYNIYCDESCHLEHDGINVMVLGATWCKADCAKDIFRDIRQIKAKHGLSKKFEAKWKKISPAKLDFYLELVDYFFDCEALHFRAVLIPDKKVLDHARYNQSHDDWYYKMLFRMLDVIIDPQYLYRIYIDIKDTRSEQKRAKLQDVLRNNQYDLSGQIIERVQQIRSYEVEIMQMTDLFIGAIAYKNRHLTSSEAKKKIVERIQERSGKSLICSTCRKESKFNILRWQAGGGKL